MQWICKTLMLKRSWEGVWEGLALPWIEAHTVSATRLWAHLICIPRDFDGCVLRCSGASVVLASQSKQFVNVPQLHHALQQYAPQAPQLTLRRESTHVSANTQVAQPRVS